MFHPALHEQDPEKRKLERKMAGINAEEERAADEARELAGGVPF